jgi:hypothetical protein
MQAVPGEVFHITGSGSADLADTNTGGGYITDPNGIILQAPPVGSPASMFFAGQQPNVGVAPAAGGFKDISFGSGSAPLPGARYGILTAGFSLKAKPTSYSDFPGGFQTVGTMRDLTAPATGGYLFFSVNDIQGFATRSDNHGSYSVELTATVPQVQNQPQPPSSSPTPTRQDVANAYFHSPFLLQASLSTGMFDAQSLADGITPVSLDPQNPGNYVDQLQQVFHQLAAISLPNAEALYYDVANWTLFAFDAVAFDFNFNDAVLDPSMATSLVRNLQTYAQRISQNPLFSTPQGQQFAAMVVELATVNYSFQALADVGTEGAVLEFVQAFPL